MSDTCAARIARAFARLGWTGVCIQSVLMIIPLLMLFYVAYGKLTGPGDTFGLTEYLAILGLLILAFTTFWSFYYTRVAKRIVAPDRRPARASIVRVLWVGLWAGCLGIFVSLLALFIEVVRLLILFLQAPQGGVPVFQTQPDSRTGWVSAMDAVSLLADLCTLAGEQLVLGITLWLLFRVTILAKDYDQSIGSADAPMP